MKSIQFFEHVLDICEQEGRKNLEAFLGKAKILEKMKKYDIGISVMSEACVLFPNFKPAQVEKAKLHIYNNEWDQAIDSITTVYAQDKLNIEALRIYTFYLMVREGDWDMVDEKMNELLDAMKKIENKNAELYFNISKLFARYCGRKELILNRTLQILDQALLLSPSNSEYQTEVGHQKQLLGDYQGAYQTFQKTSSEDDSTLQPLYGMIFCRVKQEMVDDAQH